MRMKASHWIRFILVASIAVLAVAGCAELADEPEPIRLPEEMEPEVDMPDTDIIFGIPEGPPPEEPSGPIFRTELPEMESPEMELSEMESVEMEADASGQWETVPIAPPLVDHEARSATVYYGTNRTRTGDCRAAERAPDGRCEPNRFYSGGDARRLEVGRYRVTFPKSHQKGEVERPLQVFKIRLEKEDPEKHVVIASIEPITDRQRWVGEIRESGRTEALLSVHGYNVPFEAAARQAAQVVYDLDYRGLPLLYSWPSQGTLVGYLKDEEMVRQARPVFQEFLDLVSEEVGIETLHVIAHSMGNRLVANALNDRYEAGRRERFIDQLVMAAPDIDAGKFARTFANTLPRLARRATLYVSSKDVALEASAKVHQGKPRAGHTDGGLFGLVDLDTIDASNVSTDFLAHSYFAKGESVLSDIYCLLAGATTEMRQLLEVRGQLGLQPLQAGASRVSWNIISGDPGRDPTNCGAQAGGAAPSLADAAPAGGPADAEAGPAPASSGWAVWLLILIVVLAVVALAIWKMRAG